MPPGCAWIDPVLISQLPYSCGLSAECTEIIFLKSCAQPSGERRTMTNDIPGLIVLYIFFVAMLSGRVTATAIGEHEISRTLKQNATNTVVL